jgi:hypothetical protein
MRYNVLMSTLKASSTKTISFTKEIPVVESADVVVVGGGPGGIGASVMAARNGARTLLIERYGQLGGMAAGGEVQPFMPNHAFGGPLDGPLYTEWVRRIHAYLPDEVKAGHPYSPGMNERFDRLINKEQAVLAAEDLCIEAGVNLRYHHWLSDVITVERRVKAIIASTKSGLVAIAGKVFIDASGDADLAAYAGCRYEIGGPSGHSQPMTLCFKLGNVDADRMPSRRHITELYLQAVANGEVDCPRENVLLFECVQPGVIHFNTTRVIKHSAVDRLQLSDAEIIGRRQMRQLLTFFRKSVPGYEQATLHSMGYHIGVRESRRVVGRHMLRRPAFNAMQKFPDAICRVRYCIDIHNPEGQGTIIEELPENEWYEIPYGCIVAADMDNLLIAGRPISVDHAIHSSTRVMAPAVTIGQAAGMAAAMTVSSTTPVCDLDGTEVRARLREAGARL